MNSQFIPAEQARELKELGFNEECFCTYHNGELSRNPSHRIDAKPIQGEPYTWKNNLVHNSVICAPLWQQAFDWFSNKHNLPVCLLPYIATKKDWEDELVYIPKIYTYEGIITLPMGVYEEARLACLEKLIEIVKHK